MPHIFPTSVIMLSRLVIARKLHSLGWHYKHYMADDVLHEMCLWISNTDLQINEEIHNQALILIEDMCLIIFNEGLTQLGMTTPNAQCIFSKVKMRNLIWFRETVQKYVFHLNQAQKYAYDTLMYVMNDGRQSNISFSTQSANYCNSKLQPFEKFCYGKSVAANQIDRLETKIGLVVRWFY